MTFLSVLLTLNACTGSGSSGFDASGGSSDLLEASQNEQAAIQQVTGQGGCLETEGVTLCAPTGEPPVMPTPGSQMDSPPLAVQSIDPSSGSSAPCFPQQGGCEVTIVIKATGPADTVFIGAVRLQEPFFPWIATGAFQPSAGDPSRLQVKMHLPGVDGVEPAKLQIAVLVYSGGKTPPSSGSVRLLLRDFEADQVFVATEIAIGSQPPP